MPPSEPIPHSSFFLLPEVLYLIFSYFALPPVQDYPGFDKWQFKEYKELSSQNRLSLDTLKSLRRTCHSFARAANPFLFHTLMLDLTMSSVKKLAHLSAEPQPHLTRLPRICQYFRSLCVNLDCWTEKAASTESGLKYLVESIADDDLESEAQEHGLRSASYKQMLDDCPNIANTEVRKRFETALRAWDELFTEWNPTRPLNLPTDSSRNPESIWNKYRPKGNPAAFTNGHRLYNKYFLDQRNLTDQGSSSVLLLRLEAAVRKMPLLHNLVLCDSRLLGKSIFENPLGRNGTSAEFLALPHPWHRFSRDNAELPRQVAELLFLIPMALYSERVSLRNFHLCTFPPQDFLSRQSMVLAQSLLPRACTSLETFCIRDPSLRSIAQDAIAAHDPNHVKIHPMEPGDCEFTRNYFPPILSNPNLRKVRLDSGAVHSIACLEEPVEARKRQLPPVPAEKPIFGRLSSLELNNVSVKSDQLEGFISLLRPNLQELKMSHIHLSTGNFSKTLALLRGLISHVPGCKVSVEDWSACDLLGPSTNVPAGTFFILSTSRAKKYITSDDVDATPEGLLDLHYWPVEG